MTSYTVTAPLVLVTNPDTGAVEYVYQDRPLPKYVTASRAKELLDDGFVSHDADPKDAQTDALQGYDALTKAELVAEIDKRNATRGGDDQLPATGNKADLVAALTADDNNK